MTQSLRFMSVAVLCVCTAGLYAQPTFDLTLDATGSVAGNPGMDVGFTATGSLTTNGLAEGDDGVQGWSVSVSSEGCAISAATTVGTAGGEVDEGGLRDGGFEKTEVVDPKRNEGATGAVSAVVLSFTDPITLDPVVPTEIIALDLAAQIPSEEEGDGNCRVYYVDGLVGSGQPVSNKVTFGGETSIPTLSESNTALAIVIDCRVLGVALALDYSANAASGEDALSESRISDLTINGSIGATASGNVYVGIASQYDPEVIAGVQGWSVAMAASDELVIAGATTDGTAGGDEGDNPEGADGPGLRDGGFEKTELVDPSLDAQGQGVVSAVVLSFTQPITLAPNGFDSILCIQLESSAPVTEEGAQGTVFPNDGLRGSGQPVNSVATVSGGTAMFCALEQQVLNVTIAKPDIPNAINGDSNSDGRLDIADGIWVINELFREGPASLCAPASDANDDDLYDLSDASFILNYLFFGGSSPADVDCSILPDATPENCAGESVCAS